MEKFKMSNFLLNKKMVFRDGKVNFINPMLNGEIDFYNITKEHIIKINDEVIQGLGEETSSMEVVYHLLPYFASVELDISLNQFEELCELSTCKEFSEFLGAIEKVIADMFEGIKNNTLLEDKATEFLDKNPEYKKIIEMSNDEKELKLKAEKDKIEREIGKLYEKWSKETDRKIKLKYMGDIGELENKLSEMGE